MNMHRQPDAANDNEDDVLDRVLAAIRAEPIPKFRDPPIEFPERAAIGQSGLFSRSRAMLKRLTIPAAAALVLLAGAWLLSGPQQGNAFADMKAALDEVTTLSYRMAITHGEFVKVVDIKWQGKDRVRADHAGGEVDIGDAALGTLTHFDPATKTATIIKTNEMAALINIFQILSDPAASAENEIAGKDIDGVQTLGFRVQTKTDGDLAAYVHPTTKLPIRIELGSPAGESIVIDSFVFNPQLDDAMFSTAPPAGYSVISRDLTAHSDAAAELGRANAALDEQRRALERVRATERATKTAQPESAQSP